MRVMIGKNVLLVLANIAVCYTGARFLKWGSVAVKVMQAARWARFAEIANPMCIAGTAVPINIWFIHDAKKDYAHVYQEIFSSADAKTHLRELHACLMLNALFFGRM